MERKWIDSKVGSRVGVASGVALLLVAAAASEARASIQQFSDDLEGNPGAWSVYDSSIFSSTSMQNGPASNARSGTHYGFMTMWGDPTDWSSFGESVNMTVVTPGHPRTCVAQIWVRPYSGFTAHGQLEIIDSATWTYVSIKPFNLTGSTYQAVQTSLFTLTKPNIFVRAVLIGDNTVHSAFIDDLVVQCAY